MKKLLILSIALLVAVPGVQADHGKCNSCSSSKAKKHAIKKACVKSESVCKTCKSHGKKKCACCKPGQCKCHKGKGGPVKATLKATEDVIEGAGKVLTAPLKALSGDDKYENHHKKHKAHHTIDDNDKVNNQIYIDQLEQDNAAEMNTDF